MTELIGTAKACRKCSALFVGRYCKECKKMRNSAWHAANPEKGRAATARYRAANPEKIKFEIAKYRAENPEKLRVGYAKYRTANHEKVRASVAARYAVNREKEKARAANEAIDLRDSYVAALLGGRVKELPTELIELKRIHVKILRQLKEAK